LSQGLEGLTGDWHHTQINVYAEQFLSFDPVSASNLLVLATAVGIPTRLAIGLVADRWTGAVNAFIVSGLLLGATQFLWAGVATPAAMWAFAALFGLANGALQGIWVGALAGLLGPAAQARIGTRFGMVCLAASFATLAGPPTAAAMIMAAGGGYVGAQAWAGTAIVAGSLAVMVGRAWIVGWRVWVKV
jgi:MFS transporter, MCT family, solute carrier family 16 (monocarboxylic acid transporters), member 3